MARGLMNCKLMNLYNNFILNLKNQVFPQTVKKVN